MDENKIKTDEPKVFLTRGDDGKLAAITGEQNGKLTTVAPTKENADQFLKIDTNGNVLENFFKKFVSLFNHPSHGRLCRQCNGRKSGCRLTNLSVSTTKTRNSTRTASNLKARYA